MIVDEAVEFPPEIFRFIRSPGERIDRGSYSSVAATNHVLFTVKWEMGISYYQIAKLLGIPDGPRVIRKWMRGIYRPSQTYCLRLCQLWAMFHSGVQVYYISWIDWDKSEVHWKVKDNCEECIEKGRIYHVTSGNHLFTRRRSLQKKSSELVPEMATIPDEYKGPTSAHR